MSKLSQVVQQGIEDGTLDLAVLDFLSQPFTVSMLESESKETEESLRKLWMKIQERIKDVA